MTSPTFQTYMKPAVKLRLVTRHIYGRYVIKPLTKEMFRRDGGQKQTLTSWSAPLVTKAPLEWKAQDNTGSLSCQMI